MLLLFPVKQKRQGGRREKERGYKRKGEPRTVTNRSRKTMDESWKDEVLESPTHTQRTPRKRALRLPSVTSAHACGQTTATKQPQCYGRSPGEGTSAGQLVLDMVLVHSRHPICTGWMDDYVDRRTDGWKDSRMHGQADGQMDTRTHGY